MLQIFCMLTKLEILVSTMVKQKMAFHMDKVCVIISTILFLLSTMEPGKMEKPMAMENLNGQMDFGIRESGRMGHGLERGPKNLIIKYTIWFQSGNFNPTLRFDIAC